MKGQETLYRHKFEVKNGKMIFENKGMYEANMTLLEGKKGYAVFFPEESNITNDQWAFYYGVICRKYCMESEAFSASFNNVKEISSFLLEKLTARPKIIKYPSGKTITEFIPDKLDDYNKKEMAAFIEKVIAYLAVEFNIFIEESPDNFHTKCKIHYSRK